MSDGPYAKVVPYSSVVGSSVTVHDERNGPAFIQLALLNVEIQPGEDHRKASERAAKLVADAINQYGRLGPQK